MTSKYRKKITIIGCFVEASVFRTRSFFMSTSVQQPYEQTVRKSFGKWFQNMFEFEFWMNSKHFSYENEAFFSKFRTFNYDFWEHCEIFRAFWQSKWTFGKIFGNPFNSLLMVRNLEKKCSVFIGKSFGLLNISLNVLPTFLPTNCRQGGSFFAIPWLLDLQCKHHLIK